MKKYALTFLLLPVCFCLSAKKEIPEKTTSLDITAAEIINKIFIATDSIRTLKFTFTCNERVEGHIVNMQSEIKLQTSPRKLYLKCKEAEVLWTEGKNNNEALVHPYGFPYFNLNLDPDNSFLRKGQHHSIQETGFEYLINILKVNNKQKNDKQIFLYNGEEKINDRPCFKITLINPDFAFADYTIKKNETMISIARKLNVSEYMILENNPKHSSYTDIDEGDVIKVPNAYARMTILYVDEQYQLPVVIKVYDDKGLFENYEYNSLKVNPQIPAEEFTKQFKEYNF